MSALLEKLDKVDQIKIGMFDAIHFEKRRKKPLFENMIASSAKTVGSNN